VAENRLILTPVISKQPVDKIQIHINRSSIVVNCLSLKSTVSSHLLLSFLSVQLFNLCYLVFHLIYFINLFYFILFYLLYVIYLIQLILFNLNCLAYFILFDKFLHDVIYLF
jgi:hypothetical protein